MTIRRKSFYEMAKKVNVALVKKDDFYEVYVGDVMYKRTANELFAVQVFNAI